MLTKRPKKHVNDDVTSHNILNTSEPFEPSFLHRWLSLASYHSCDEKQEQTNQPLFIPSLPPVLVSGKSLMSQRVLSCWHVSRVELVLDAAICSQDHICAHSAEMFPCSRITHTLFFLFLCLQVLKLKHLREALCLSVVSLFIFGSTDENPPKKLWTYSLFRGNVAVFFMLWFVMYLLSYHIFLSCLADAVTSRTAGSLLKTNSHTSTSLPSVRMQTSHFKLCLLYVAVEIKKNRSFP